MAALRALGHERALLIKQHLSLQGFINDLGLMAWTYLDRYIAPILFTFDLIVRVSRILVWII